MWYDFTEQGKKVIRTAQNIAMERQAEEVGTEHILSALLNDVDGIVTKILEKNSLNITEVSRDVDNLCAAKSDIVVPDMPVIDIPTSYFAKRAMENAMNEAKAMKVAYIGTEHILLGILKEERCTASQYLISRGINFESCRNIVSEILSGSLPEKLAPEKGDHFLQNNITNNKAERKKVKTPVLDKYAINLTELAVKGELDPVVGREKETDRVIRILSRRTKNNPVLIGEPGVGKTAIVEGLALKIISGDVPVSLRDFRVMQLNMTSVVAGTKYRGEFEERLHRLVKELITDSYVILFIDEIHTLVGAGNVEGGALDAANILKPALSRGKIQIIGATTTDEYRKHIEKDAALERRFQPVTVNEPETNVAIDILKNLRNNYEKYHGVHIEDEALNAAVELSQRYISDRYLPDKAIDLMDEACANARVQQLQVPERIKTLENAVISIRKEKLSAAASQDFEKAVELRDRERELVDNVALLKNKWRKELEKTAETICADDIARVLSESTGIPVQRLTEKESKRLLNMEDIITRHLVGQDEAVSAVAKAIRRSSSGIKNPNRPVGSFMFLGPTGVGKTELAKTLAEFLFGRKEALIRVDMSEYMDKHDSAKLIGAPPGYVGYDEGGKLTEAVRRNPYSVILFDEIEKAHPDVFNVLLQTLDDGRLTDGHGRVTDFRHCIIIMTSNIGVKEALSGTSMGFESSGEEVSGKHVKSVIQDAVEKAFRPEFLNRIDKILIFNPLTKENLLEITREILEEIKEKADKCGVVLTYTDYVPSVIVSHGYDKRYGARPLRRTAENLIEDILATLVLKKKGEERIKIHIHVKNGELEFETK